MRRPANRPKLWKEDILDLPRKTRKTVKALPGTAWLWLKVTGGQLKVNYVPAPSSRCSPKRRTTRVFQSQEAVITSPPPTLEFATGEEDVSVKIEVWRWPPEPKS